MFATYHRSVAAADRVEEIFALVPEPSGGQAPRLRGGVVVRDLTFRFDEQEQPALEHVSFALEPGQKLGIVGPVGSGKSTLLALLVRLYDPPRGTIFVDGVDVLDLEPRVLREAFAFAPQDPFLFSDTIRGNVTFGLPSGASGDLPSDADIDADVAVAAAVERAVHASALDQDVERFEGGLEAIVGERGITLSGGQKQRVSLARALAANRATLVLDDTLSAVDYATEAKILQRLAQARHGRSMLVATHRLMVVEDADLILVLRRGRVVESGTHDELLARGGLYAAAWALQVEERAIEQAEPVDGQR